ncbi:MAG: hypothetical protein ACI8QQ_002557, partial [Psychroserpens sp.]
MTSKIHDYLTLHKFNMSKKLGVIFSIIVLLFSCASVEKHNLQVTQLHPVEDLHEDIDNAYTQLQR